MQDEDALMKLLTFEAWEDLVKRRVGKNSMVICQDVSLDGWTETGEKNSSQFSFRVASSLIYKLVDE
jgi:chorismate mutase